MKETKGKKATVLGVEFGEQLLWKRHKGANMGKLRSRWELGIFVGVRRKSGEVWVATKEWVIVKARSVRRIPEEDRLGPDCLRWVKNVPWNRYLGRRMRMGISRRNWWRKGKEKIWRENKEGWCLWMFGRQYPGTVTSSKRMRRNTGTRGAVLGAAVGSGGRQGNHIRRNAGRGSGTG